MGASKSGSDAAFQSIGAARVMRNPLDAYALPVQ